MTPTVGRIVYYRRTADGPEQAAIVCWASEDGTRVNLLAVAPDAVPRGLTDVPFVQEGGVRPESGHFAHWMPFQVGQAAKTQAAEGKLAERVTALEQKLVELEAAVTAPSSTPVANPEPKK